MTRYGDTSLIAAFSTGKAKPLSALWTGVLRVVSCVVLALILSLFTAPGSAQAHGLHGLQGGTAQVAVMDGLTKADVSGGSEVTASDCVTCCASSGCVSGSIPETFDLSDITAPKRGFQAVSNVAVYQMALNGLRRPPKHYS